METKDTLIVPDYAALHPATVMLDLVKKRRLTKGHLVRELSMKHSELNKFLQGGIRMDNRWAEKLAKCFYTSSDLWINLQVDYDLKVHAKPQDTQIIDEIAATEKFPLVPKSPDPALLTSGGLFNPLDDLEISLNPLNGPVPYNQLVYPNLIRVIDGDEKDFFEWLNNGGIGSSFPSITIRMSVHGSVYGYVAEFNTHGTGIHFSSRRGYCTTLTTDEEPKTPRTRVEALHTLIQCLSGRMMYRKTVETKRHCLFFSISTDHYHEMTTLPEFKDYTLEEVEAELLKYQFVVQPSVS